MSDNLEGFVLAEAKRLGFNVSAEVVLAAATDLCGASLTADGLIQMPGRGSISKGDFVRSLRTAMPDGFTTITDKPATPAERRPGESMTDFMRRQAKARPQKPLPSDWETVRSRMTGLTAESMDHISKNRRA